MKVAEQLRVVRIEVLGVVLALDQQDRLAFAHNGVVYLLPFLDPDVGNELRVHLEGVKHIVAQQLYKGHNKRILGCFFGLDLRAQLFDPPCKLQY